VPSAPAMKTRLPVRKTAFRSLAVRFPTRFGMSSHEAARHEIVGEVLIARLVVSTSLIAMTASAALAGGSGEPDRGGWNLLVGPVLGVTWGHGHRVGVSVGVKGGVGHSLVEKKGPTNAGLDTYASYANVRLNLGLQRRAGELFGYAELDPWVLIGASAGVGIGARSGVQPVVGVWEGTARNDCSDVPDLHAWRFAATIAIGYRYSGVHEVYVTPKLGNVRCVD
jgi:hypothetical protein